MNTDSLMMIVLSAIIFILLLYIIVSDRSHQKERKDLYDRLMAKDFVELKTIDSAPQAKNPIKRRLEEDLSQYLKE